MFLNLKTLGVLLLHKMDYRIEGQSDLLKDPSKGSVINTDTTAYQRYMQSKSQNMKFQDAVSDINNLKAEVSEIKTLLTEFLKKNGN